MTTIDLPISTAPIPADTDNLRPATQHHFKTWDGVELFYRAWLPVAPARQALFLFHRGHEHSGRFAEMVDRLELDDVAIFAWDARGHGQSPGERGYANDFADVIRDIDCFVHHVAGEFGIPISEMLVLGHSVAAVAVAAWVHDYAPPIRGMILATPAFRVKLYMPFAVEGLRAMSLVRKKAFIKSYVKAGMLTHDPDQVAAYAADPLISRQIAVNVLLDLFDTSTRLLADAGAIEVPTLVLSAEADWVVKNGPQKAFFDRLSSPVKRRVMLEDFHHAIFHEKDRSLAIAEVRRFVREQFSNSTAAGNGVDDRSVGPALAVTQYRSAQAAPTDRLLRADVDGFTKREYDRLSTPRSFFSPTGISLVVQKLFLQTIGRLSRGVSLGWNTGFDSGRSLDYIYENQARGFTPIGKLIDRVYLNAVGWRGIRQRKVHLQQLLLQTIGKIREEGRPVRLLDVAAGPGRYLLETIQKVGGGDLSAVLRDQNPEPLEMGRTLARDMGLANVTYEVGDAFDSSALAAVTPQSNIAIVSGLFELFPDNAKILAALRGLAEALRDNGGYLLYTNQPWHPQVEMIARVLRNRIGQPWIMRRRTQAEMDELVRSVGFDKIDMLIDRWGIFTVSVAVMRPRTSTTGSVL